MFDYAKGPYADTIDDPIERQAFVLYVNTLEDQLLSNNKTMCEYGFTIEGVLDNQAEIYMNSYDDIVTIIQKKARLMQNILTLQTNATISTPLMKEFTKTELL